MLDKNLLILYFASFFLFQLLILSEQQIIPDPSRHEISFEEEYEAFENDLITSIPAEEAKSRTKRFIYMNYDTYVAVALLVGVPVSLVLPSLGNIFSKWRRKRRNALEIDDGYDPTFYTKDDPSVQPELDRISTYFDLVDIPEPSCQLRAICEFSANPDKYYPLSEMILSRIRNPNLPPLIYLENNNAGTGGRRSGIQQSEMIDNTTFIKGSNNTTTEPVTQSLFKIYNNTANEGSEHGYGLCENKFGTECHYSMDKLLNMPTLRFWTAMQRFLKLRFTDGSLSF